MKRTNRYRAEQQIDNYSLISLLGNGRSAEVWTARDDETGVRVALKLFDPEYEHLAGVERRMLRSLSPADVVQLIDDTQQPYLVMKVAGTRTLRDELKERGRLRPIRASRIAVSLANTLAYAHSKDITHADLKPENIILDGKGAPIICDWSSATAVDDLLLSTSVSMREDLPMASLPYMAPEQREGEGPTWKTDMYQLGVVFHEMLTGKRAKASDEVGIGDTTYVPQSLLSIIQSGLLLSNPDNRLPAMALALTLNNQILPKLRNSVVSPSGRYVKPVIAIHETALGAQSTSDFKEDYLRAVDASRTQLARGFAVATLMGMIALGMSTSSPEGRPVEHKGICRLQIGQGQQPIPQKDLPYVGPAIMRRED